MRSREPSGLRPERLGRPRGDHQGSPRTVPGIRCSGTRRSRGLACSETRRSETRRSETRRSETRRSETRRSATRAHHGSRCSPGPPRGPDGVGAAHAERADTGDQPIAGGGPLPGGPDDLEGPGRRTGCSGWGLEVEARRELAVPETENDLEQAGGARRAFQVADVRLDRPDQQRIARGAGSGVGRAEGGGLDRVAHLRAGAVQLDVLDGSAGATPAERRPA